MHVVRLDDVCGDRRGTETHVLRRASRSDLLVTTVARCIMLVTNIARTARRREE
jgi:hypothetical protein